MRHLYTLTTNQNPFVKTFWNINFLREQFNLTLFDLYIKTLYTSAIIYLKSSATNLRSPSNIHLRSTNRNLHGSVNKSQTFLLSDFSREQFNWHRFELYIRTLYTSKRNQIYCKSSNKQVPITAKIHLRSTNQNFGSQERKCRHFRQLSDFSRKTIQFNIFVYISKHFTHINAIKYIINLLRWICSTNILITVKIHLRLKSKWILICRA